MDPVQSRLFIKNLIYDLNTVQYLFDYGRIKETLPHVEKTLVNIDGFRAAHGKTGIKAIFDEAFWKDKSFGGMSCHEMRVYIAQHSGLQTLPNDEELEKIQYKVFVENLLQWAEENITVILREIKTPFQKKCEKFFLYGAIVVLCLCLLMGLLWNFYTSNWGLKGDFYQGENFEKYLYSHSKKVINFNSPEEMDSAISHDHFSTRWHGEILIPSSGEYLFSTESDDGNRLFIDDQLLIDVWNGEGYHAGNRAIFLSKGSHKIVLEYYQAWGEAYLRLYWSRDGAIMREIVPSAKLRHD